MKKESSKINKTLLITVIILIIIIIGLICFITTQLGDKTNEKTEVIETSNTETEIKDINLITELSIKIDTLLAESDKTYHQTNTYEATKYRFEVLKQTLTKEEKQMIVLDNIKWLSMQKELWEKAKSNAHIKKLIRSYSEQQVYETTKYITPAEVNKYSMELFGEEIDPTIISESSKYVYDKTTSMFYFPEPQYGGTSASSIKSYKSKYEKKNDEAYVYVSFIFLSQTGTNSVLDKFSIYKDFEITDTSGYKKINYVIIILCLYVDKLL